MIQGSFEYGFPQKIRNEYEHVITLIGKDNNGSFRFCGKFVRYKIMKSIAARYTEIKDAIVYDNKEDELISECYKYKIFKDNPSKKFKNGTWPLIADKCATLVKSMISWTLEFISIANPVIRVA